MKPALRAKTTLLMIRRGETREILRELAARIHSDEASFVLRRDLSLPLTPRPAAKIPVRVRPLEPRDLPQIVAERPRRLPVLQERIPTCYVATAEDGSICYMQWLVTAD